MFRRSEQRYGRTSDPITPYQKAAQEWDTRLGSARVQARSWRLMAFAQFLLVVALGAGLAWQSARSGIVPYVVAIDRVGQATAIGPATRSYQPRDGEIAWHLARFIGNVRALSFDPILVRQNWLEAYDYARGHAVRTLDEFARAADPFSAIGSRTVAVDVISVIRASPESFQVKWQESTYERGSLVETTAWTAILGIAMDPPRDAETLSKNPLGLYVHNLAWSRDLTTVPPSPQEN
jgi:type IV secretion system protein VirB5